MMKNAPGGTLVNDTPGGDLVNDVLVPPELGAHIKLKG